MNRHETITIQPKFDIGTVVATPAALGAIQGSGQSPAEFLRRHVRGDWGDLCAEDRAANRAALLHGTRLLSVYKTARGVPVWIITEGVDESGRRGSTTILLPDEY